MPRYLKQVLFSPLCTVFLTGVLSGEYVSKVVFRLYKGHVRTHFYLFSILLKFTFYICFKTCMNKIGQVYNL